MKYTFLVVPVESNEISAKVVLCRRAWSVPDGNSCYISSKPSLISALSLAAVFR